MHPKLPTLSKLDSARSPELLKMSDVKREIVDDDDVKSPSNDKKSVKSERVKTEAADTDGALVPDVKPKLTAKDRQALAAQAKLEREEAHKKLVETGLSADRGAVKWKTLEHNGVMFAPEYIPHGLPILYDGKPVKLSPEGEEVAMMYAAMHRHALFKNLRFCVNFFSDWRKILDRTMPDHPIRALEKCDFTTYSQYIDNEREEKKKRTPEQRKAETAAREAAEKPFKTCMMDGVEQPVGNFRIEPPGLFRGRGDHPLLGHLKPRVLAKDITINIGEDAKVPTPPEGQQWQAVVHNHNVGWLAKWTAGNGKDCKYVQLHQTSSLKALSDESKFNKARALKGKIDRIRSDYNRDAESTEILDRERATALYLIDRLALRVGGAKDEDEADTVGCCTLRVEHVAFNDDGSVTLSFLGKDSIQYHNVVRLEPRFTKLLKSFTLDCTGKPKPPTDLLFGHLEPSHLNEFLKQYMPGLSVKVFRTYNASYCMAKELRDNPCPPDATLAEKKAYFTAANTKVAILCNHQRAVSAATLAKMERLEKEKVMLQQLITRAERHLKRLKAGDDADDLAAEWDKEEIAVQAQWIKQYGTDEQKEEWEEAKRNGTELAKAVGTRAKREPGSSGGDAKKRARAAKPKKKKASAKKSAKKTTKKAAAKKKPTKKKTMVDDDDESSSGGSGSGSESGSESSGSGSSGSGDSSSEASSAPARKRRASGKARSALSSGALSGKRKKLVDDDDDSE